MDYLFSFFKVVSSATWIIAQAEHFHLNPVCSSGLFIVMPVRPG